MIDPTTLPVFGFEPNWNSSPELHFRAFTDVSTSATGREERTGRILSPALTVKFQVDTQDHPDVSRAVIRFMRANLGASILVPLWTEMVQLTAAAGTTLTAAALSTRLFNDQRACILWRDSSYCEAFQPTAGSVTDTQVVSSTSLVNAWQAGDWLVPAIITAPFSDPQVRDWISGYQVQGDAIFAEALDEAAPWPSVSLPSFRSRMILPFRFNRADVNPQEATTRQVMTRVSDIGLVAAAITETTAREALHGTLMLQNRSQFAAFAAFFTVTLGRLVRFYAPSDQPDFVLAAAHSSTSATLVVKSTGYAANEFNDATRVMILIRDGSAWHARKITNAVDNDDGTETLTLESSVIALSSLALISFLYLVRSSLDELALTFDSTEISSCPVGLVEVPQEIDNSGTLPADGTMLSAGQLLVATSAPSVPGIPQNLTGAVISSTAVFLSWDFAATATGYYIYRNNVLIKTANGRGTGFTDTGLAAANTYSYSVAAFNAVGPSPICAPVPVTIPAGFGSTDTTPPADPVPTTLTLALQSRTAAAITFVATVFDQYSRPFAGVTVPFAVTGAHSASGSGVTNAQGRATFTWAAGTTGTDSVAAFADTNNNASKDSGEPSATATITTIASPHMLISSISADTNPQTLGSGNVTITVVIQSTGTVDAIGLYWQTQYPLANWSHVSSSVTAGSISRPTAGSQGIVAVSLPVFAAGVTLTLTAEFTPLITGSSAFQSSAIASGLQSNTVSLTEVVA